MGCVGKGGFSCICSGLERGTAKELRVITLIFQYPAYHAQGQRHIHIGPHRNPFGLVAHGVSGGEAQYRIHHGIVQLAVGAGLGHHAGRMFERIASLSGRSAPEEGKFAVFKIRLSVGVCSQIIQYKA